MTVPPLRAVMGLSPSKPAAAGIGIAIVDSGIAPSDDFLGRITAFYDFTQGGIATAPVDPYGHGTHIAGIIGSSGIIGGSDGSASAADRRRTTRSIAASGRTRG